jgi:hypothetical protein
LEHLVEKFHWKGDRGEKRNGETEKIENGVIGGTER